MNDGAEICRMMKHLLNRKMHAMFLTLLMNMAHDSLPFPLNAVSFLRGRNREARGARAHVIRI